MIFLTVTSSFLGMVWYDRRQQRATTQKWIAAVSHLAHEPLPPLELPRKVTVYLASPPGDGLTPAREHWQTYVKPILVAAAVDYDIVEGRVMEELRFKIAEEVRERRRRGDSEDEGIKVAGGAGVVTRGGKPGAVVIGRHVWKEWVRGTHEGWLGPLEEPVPPAEEPQLPVIEEMPVAAMDGMGKPEEQTQSVEEEVAKKQKEEEEKKKKSVVPPEYILPSMYSTTPLPAELPAELPPVTIIQFPHLLGFFNTPVRVYRYVTRRFLADEIGREAAAICLGLHRPFYTAPEAEGTSADTLDVESGLQERDQHGGEVARILKEEEDDWPAKTWKEERYRGVWTEDVKEDERIIARMRRFFVHSEAEHRAEEMAE